MSLRQRQKVQEVLREELVNGTCCFMLAAESTASFWEDVHGQLSDPLFWFGMVAQGLFFGRFIVQWIVSERRRRSTVPTAFWYLSLVGGFSLFIYAFLRHDLVIMLGQLLACVIYARNLMLIRSFEARRRRAGFPVTQGDETAEPGGS